MMLLQLLHFDRYECNHLFHQHLCQPTISAGKVLVAGEDNLQRRKILAESSQALAVMSHWDSLSDAAYDPRVHSLALALLNHQEFQIDVIRSTNHALRMDCDSSCVEGLA